MTVNEFKESLLYNEPTFGYKGKEYSICSPENKYYVLSEDNPADSELEFDSIDDLLDRWMIQGKPLRDIISDIDYS